MNLIDDQSPPARNRFIGQRCGGSYVITSILGQGGMGTVYLATSEMLAGKLAAVKVLSPELTRHSEAVARFRAEVYAAGKIDDPNIVEVFDAGELEGDRLYMMMEYCAGGSLAALLEKRGPLSIELVIAIACPIGSALHAAHTQAKITHRDIKPANILLVQEPGGLLRSKLADFGIAKLHDEQLTFGMRTGTQNILGSPGYMAPEQCIGRGGIDGRADIYAFGSVLYEMVTGQRPYAGDSVFELITNVVSNTPFPRPGQLRHDLPPEWDAVIMGCLAHRREDRIQTIQEVVRRLARATANGESLMSYLAPRLVDDKLAPSAMTISDGIGPAVTRWADSQLTASGRRRRGRVRGAAMLLSAALAGSGATAVVAYAIADRSVAPIASATPVPSSVQGSPGLGNAGRPPDMLRVGGVSSPADGGVSTSTGGGTPSSSLAGNPPARLPVVNSPNLPPARVAVGADTPSAPRDAGVDAPLVAVISIDGGMRGAAITADVGGRRRDPAPIENGSGAPVVPRGPPRPAPVVERRPAQGSTERGTLRVEVDPWADVAISGEKDAHTTPLTIMLTAGPHRVVLTKGGRKETIDVNITPNETTRITRTW